MGDMRCVKRARKDGLKAVSVIRQSKSPESVVGSDTFLTNWRKASRRSTSSASRQSWSAPYAREHSVRSAVRFALVILRELSRARRNHGVGEEMIKV